jgi:hypothetical protein
MSRPLDASGNLLVVAKLKAIAQGLFFWLAFRQRRKALTIQGDLARRLPRREDSAWITPAHWRESAWALWATALRSLVG